MLRLQSLFFALALALSSTCALAGCAATTDDVAPADEAAPAAFVAVGEAEQNANGRIGSHGMVLFGDKSGSAYLSHIPVFGPPHDVQLLLEIKLVAPAASIPATFSDRLYTFLPDRLSLDALRLGTLRAITGKIFLGNFEQGGTVVASGVKADVARVVHQHELKATDTQSASTYLLLGAPDKAFAVHRIAGSPSFDQVLAVQLGARRPSPEALAEGLVVTAAGATDAQASRLRSARAVTGPAAAPPAAAAAPLFDLAQVTELSCLEGPDFASPCL